MRKQVKAHVVPVGLGEQGQESGSKNTNLLKRSAVESCLTSYWNYSSKNTHNPLKFSKCWRSWKHFGCQITGEGDLNKTLMQPKIFLDNVHGSKFTSSLYGNYQICSLYQIIQNNQCYREILQQFQSVQCLAPLWVDGSCHIELLRWCNYWLNCSFRSCFQLTCTEFQQHSSCFLDLQTESRLTQKQPGHASLPREIKSEQKTRFVPRPKLEPNRHTPCSG